MSNIRLIPRLDIKGPNLIKGIHFEGLRVLGDPKEYAESYYAQFADELIYIDAVASLYGRNNLREIVKRTANNIFVPLTVGGGIRNIEDVRDLLRSGADKISINTAAVQNPKLISEIAKTFGSQCVVVSIEAKKIAHQQWEVFTDYGRERTGLDVIKWTKTIQSLGAGEILLTSIDKEGTGKGFDLELIEAVSNVANIPIIVSGGMGELEHFADVCKLPGINGVAMANILHYKHLCLKDIRNFAKTNNILVRQADAVE